MNTFSVHGRCGKDSELAYTPNGTAVCKVSLAETQRVKEGNEYKDKTQWYDVVAWGKTAENLDKVAKKGTLLYIMGTLRLVTWQGKDDKEHHKLEITVEKYLPLSPKSSGDAPASVPADEDNFPF